MLNKFQEVELLLQRADKHLKWLRPRVVHPEPDLAVKNEGNRIISESSFDFTVANITLTIGEFASCLRNALNYLTCAVAEQDSGRVGKSVQFPIESCQDHFERHRSSYLEGVRDDHVAFFKQFQPYVTGYPSWIMLLQRLTNWYRHHGLIRVKKQLYYPHVPTLEPETVTIGGIEMQMRHDLSFAVSFDDGLPIIETLEKLQMLTRYTIEEFKSPLERYISLNIEYFLK